MENLISSNGMHEDDSAAAMDASAPCGVNRIVAARLLETFLDLVRIPSPSFHEGRVAEYCTTVLEGCGCDVTVDGSAAATGSDTGNVVATLHGDVPAHIYLAAHMDTVGPCDAITPIIEDGMVRSDGTSVLGADDKAGVAAILECMGVLSGIDRLERPTVSAVFTTCEEVGLLGSANLDDGLLEPGGVVLVCDGDAAPGTVTCASAHQYRFDLVFHGRAAHAGVAPERGVNAITMAARAISAMPIGRIDDRAVSNVGYIEGGAMTNIVPDTCSLTGECRALTQERLDEIRSRIEDGAIATAADFGGTVDSTWTKTVEGFDFDEDDPWVRLVLDAAVDCGLVPATEFSLGATDGNNLVSRGVHPVEIGTGMTDFHSTTEHIAIADLEATASHLVSACLLAGKRFDTR